MNTHYQPLKDISSKCLYETPQKVAELMVQAANIQPHDLVLEPSAGKGAIVKEIVKKSHGILMLCEMNLENQTVLRSLGYVYRTDFFKLPNALKFDKIIMNPPLRNDIEHIIKAIKHLEKNGRLIALIHTQTARTKEYNDLLKRNDIRIISNCLAPLYFDDKFSALLIKIEHA